MNRIDTIRMSDLFVLDIQLRTFIFGSSVADFGSFCFFASNSDARFIIVIILLFLVKLLNFKKESKSYMILTLAMNYSRTSRISGYPRDHRSRVVSRGCPFESVSV